MIYWLLKNVLVGPFLRLMFRPKVVGVENIPKKGPVILASNHLAVIDSFILPLVLKRSVVFIGKSEYFTGKGLKGKFIAKFMLSVGTIPVDRSGGRAGDAALKAGLSRLNEGEMFGIYPEGTRSPDGRLYRGKTGVARLALEAGAPVVPVAMIGTNKAQPIGKRLPKPMKIHIVIGKPIDFSRFEGLHQDRFILRAVTDEVMYGISEVSRQEYVDVYASTIRAKHNKPVTKDQ